MILIKEFENYSASDYYDAVTIRPERASEAIYYLLKKRLVRAMGRVFELHGFGLDDHFDDTIDDFFLYLYDRGDGRPFAILETVRERQAFFGWMVGTYRNFLLNKAKDEMKRREMMEAARSKDEEEHQTDERLVYFIATAIAYADQELPPRNRFIFFRMLLTILDHKLSLPQELVAQAMGMHPVTYRVCVNRLKTRLSDDVTCLEAGQRFQLDNAHLLMQNRLMQGFDRLYDTLLPYYETALHALSGAMDISELRESYANGIVMHEETQYSYPHRINARELFQRLKS